jgi:hypothetical protein
MARARAALVSPGAVDRCDHGLDRAASGPRSTPCAATRPDRRGPRHARADGGFGDPRKPPRRRRPACRTPIASAASRRCWARALDLLRQAGADAGDRGQCGDRQSAGAGGRRARSFRAATSTPSRWPSPPTRSRWPSPRSGRSRSAGRADGRSDAQSFDLPPFLTPEAGPEFGPHDRRSHHRRADEREQASRQSLLDRFDADLAPIRKTMSAWPPTARAAGADDRQTCRHPRRRGDVRRPGRRTARAACRLSPALQKRRSPACAPRCRACRRPLHGARSQPSPRRPASAAARCRGRWRALPSWSWRMTRSRSSRRRSRGAGPAAYRNGSARRSAARLNETGRLSATPTGMGRPAL